MRRSTSSVRRACALGTTAALVVLTTGLGIVTATAAHADTAPTAPATDAPATSDPTTAPGEPASTDGATPPADTAPAGSGTDTSTPPASGATDGDAAQPTGSTKPSGTTSKPAGTDQEVAPAAAEKTVTITGDAKVGSTLTAQRENFEPGTLFGYQWLDAAGAPIDGATDATWTVGSAFAGTKVSVEVTATVAGGGTETVTSKQSPVITQDPVFVDASGTPIEGGTEADDDTLYLDDAIAGEDYSYTFRAQGYPAPTYQLEWFYGNEEDSMANIEFGRAQSGIGFGEGEFDPDVNGDGKVTPADQLPKGMSFDAATGEVSGVPTEAAFVDFAVSATSGKVTTTQYVGINVDPGAAYGLAAVALDEGLTMDKPGNYYVIRPDGSVSGVSFTPDGDGFSDEKLLDHVSVKQGGSLLVLGTPVDRFGNDISVDSESDLPRATVTSNVASDVIAPYTEDGADVLGVSSVTFPHASTHTLTVSAQELQPVSFDVEVIPTVAPAAAVTPTGTGAQLAYTGTDATGALPWAIGLVLAGAGIIGARTLRRRQTER